MTVLIDATTAQHARGIGTVIGGILDELGQIQPTTPLSLRVRDLQPMAGVGFGESESPAIEPVAISTSGC